MREASPTLVEKFRLTHYPLPPASIKVVFDEKRGPSCDIETLTIYLKERVDPDVLEFDYRHEVEHILSHPRDVANTFKVFYYGLKRCSDRKLWKKVFHRVHNAACDMLINHKVAQLYEGARRGLRKELEKLRGKVRDPVVKLVARVAEHSLKGVWPGWLPRREDELTLRVFEELKDYFEKCRGGLGSGDAQVPFNLGKVAVAAVELVEAGEDPRAVIEAVVMFAESCGEKVDRKEVSEKVEEAYVWRLFEWSWKVSEDVKVSVEEFREVHDLWRVGEPVEKLLVRETLLSYGYIVPGHNTLKKVEVKWSKCKPKLEKGGARVAVLLDASGSMRDCGGLKARAARDAAISLIGACAKHKYPVKVVVFNGSVDWCTKWREDHYNLALELLRRYKASGGTNITPALKALLWDAKPEMTVYLISDMEIHDIRRSARYWARLAKYNPRIVVFLIGTDATPIVNTLKQAGIRDIKGYSLKPSEYKVLREKAVRELSV